MAVRAGLVAAPGDIELKHLDRLRGEIEIEPCEGGCETSRTQSVPPRASHEPPVDSHHDYEYESEPHVIT